MPTGNAWKDIPDAVEVKLKSDTNEMLFRTVNLAGVSGPEYKVTVLR